MHSQMTRSLYACYRSVKCLTNGHQNTISRNRHAQPMVKLLGGPFANALVSHRRVQYSAVRRLHDEIGGGASRYNLPAELQSYLDQDDAYRTLYGQFWTHCSRSQTSVSLGASREDGAVVMEKVVRDAFANDQRGALIYTSVHYYLTAGVMVRPDFLKEIVQMRVQWAGVHDELGMVLGLMYKFSLAKDVELFKSVVSWYAQNYVVGNDTRQFFDFIGNYMPRELQTAEYLVELYSLLSVHHQLRQQNPLFLKELVKNYNLSSLQGLPDMLAGMYGRGRLMQEFLQAAQDYKMHEISSFNIFLREVLTNNVKGFKYMMSKKFVSEEINAILAVFTENGATEDAETYNLMLKFHLIIGDVDKAAKLFAFLRNSRMPVEDALTAKVMSALVLVDRTDEALSIYTRDRAEGIKYHGVVYERLILVLLKHNKRSEGLSVFYQMLEGGYFPSFHILLRVLSRRMVSTHTIRHVLYYFQLLLDRLVVLPAEQNAYANDEDYIESIRMRSVYQFGAVVNQLGLDVDGTMVERRLYPQLRRDELPPGLLQSYYQAEEEQNIDRLRAVALGQQVTDNVLTDEETFNSGLLRPDQYLPSLSDPHNKPLFYSEKFAFAPAHLQLPVRRLGTPLLILRHMLALRSKEQWNFLFYTIRRMNFVVERLTLDKLMATVAVFDKDLLLDVFFYIRETIVSTYARLRSMYSKAYQQELMQSFEVRNEEEEFSEDEGTQANTEPAVMDPLHLASDSLAVYQVEQLKTFPDDVGVEYWDLLANRVSAENSVALNERVLQHMETEGIVSSRHLFVFSMLSLNTALNSRDVERCATVLINYYSNLVQQTLEQQASEDATYTATGFLSLLASLYTGDCTPQQNAQSREVRSDSLVIEACVLINTFNSHSNTNNVRDDVEFATEVVNAVLQQLPALGSFHSAIQPKNNTHSLEFIEELYGKPINMGDSFGVQVRVDEIATGPLSVDVGVYDFTLGNQYNQFGEQAATISFLQCTAIMRSLSQKGEFSTLQALQHLLIGHGIQLSEDVVAHIGSTLLSVKHGAISSSTTVPVNIDQYFILRYQLSFLSRYLQTVPNCVLPNMKTLPCFTFNPSEQPVLQRLGVVTTGSAPAEKQVGADTTQVFTQNPALSMLASQFGINTQQTESEKSKKQSREYNGVLHMSESGAATYLSTYFPSLPLFSSPIFGVTPTPVRDFSDLAPRPDIPEHVLRAQYQREQSIQIGALNESSLTKQISEALEIGFDYTHQLLLSAVPNHAHALTHQQVLNIVEAQFRRRPKIGAPVRSEYTALLHMCVNSVMEQRYLLNNTGIASILKLCIITQQFDLVSMYVLYETRRKKNSLSARVVEDMLLVLSQKDFDVIASQQRLQRVKVLSDRDNVAPTVEICKELMKLSGVTKLSLYEQFFSVMAPHAQQQTEVWNLFMHFREVVHEGTLSKYKTQKEAYDNHMMIYRLYVIRYLTAVRTSDPVLREIRSYDALKQWLESPLPTDVQLVSEWRNREEVVDLRVTENVTERLITFASHRDMFRMLRRQVPEPIEPTLTLPANISTAILQGGAFFHEKLRTLPDILAVARESGMPMDDAFFEILLGSTHRLPLEEILPTFQAIVQHAVSTLNPEFLSETGALFNRGTDKTKFLGFKFQDIRERLGAVFCKFTLKRPQEELLTLFFAFQSAGLYPPLHTMIDLQRQACSERRTEAVAALISLYFRSSVSYNSLRGPNAVSSPPIIHYSRDGRAFSTSSTGWNAVARVAADAGSVLKPHLNRASRHIPVGQMSLLSTPQNEYDETDLVIPGHIDGLSSRLSWVSSTKPHDEFVPKMDEKERKKNKKNEKDTNIVDYQLPPLFTTTRMATEQGENKRKENLLYLSRVLNRLVIDCKANQHKSDKHVIEPQQTLSYKDNALFYLNHLNDVLGWTVRNVAYIEDLPKARRLRLEQYKMQEDSIGSVQDEDAVTKTPQSQYLNRNSNTMSQLSEFTEDIGEDVFERNKARISDALLLPTNVTHMSPVPIENSFSKFPAYFEAMYLANTNTLYRSMSKNSGPTYIPSSVLSQALDVLIEAKQFPLHVYEAFQLLSRVVGQETMNAGMIVKALTSIGASIDDMEQGNRVLGVAEQDHTTLMVGGKSCAEQIATAMESQPLLVSTESKNLWFKGEGLFPQTHLGPMNVHQMECADRETMAMRLIGMMENVFSVEKLRDEEVYNQFMTLFKQLRVVPLVWTRLTALPGAQVDVLDLAVSCIDDGSVYEFPIHGIELLSKCDDHDENIKTALNKCVVLACLDGALESRLEYASAVLTRVKQSIYDGQPSKNMLTVLSVLYNNRVSVSKKVYSALELVAGSDCMEILDRLRSKMRKSDGQVAVAEDIECVPDYITSGSNVPVRTLGLVPRVIPVELRLTMDRKVSDIVGTKANESEETTLIPEVHREVTMNELSKTSNSSGVRAIQMSELLAAQLYVFGLVCQNRDTFHSHSHEGTLAKSPVQDWKSSGLDHIGKQELTNKIFSSIAAVLPPVSKMFEHNEVVHRHLRTPKAMFQRSGIAAEDSLTVQEKKQWDDALGVFVKDVEEVKMHIEDATQSELLIRNVKPFIVGDKKQIAHYMGAVGRAVQDFLPVMLGQQNMIFLTRNDVMNIKSDLRAQLPYAPPALVTALADVNTEHSPLPSGLVHRTTKEIVAFIHTNHSLLSKAPMKNVSTMSSVMHSNFVLAQSSYRQSDHVPASAAVSRLCNILARVLASTPNSDVSVMMLASYICTGNWSMALFYEDLNHHISSLDFKHMCKILVLTSTTSKLGRQMMTGVGRKYLPVPHTMATMLELGDGVQAHLSTISGLSKELRDFQLPLLLTLLMPRAPLCVRMRKDWFAEICKDSRSVRSDQEKVIGTPQLKSVTLRGLFSLACRVVQRGNGHLQPMAAVAMAVHAGPDSIGWAELARGLERSFSDKLYDPCVIAQSEPAAKHPFEQSQVYYGVHGRKTVMECSAYFTPDHTFWSQVQHKSHTVEALHGLLRSSKVLKTHVGISALGCYLLQLTSCLPSGLARFALHSQIDARKHMELHARVQNAAFLTQFMVDHTVLSLPLQMLKDENIEVNSQGRFLSGTALTVGFRHAVKQQLTFVLHTTPQVLNIPLYTAQTTEVIPEDQVNSLQKEALLTQVVPLLVELEEARRAFKHCASAYSDPHVSTEDQVMGEFYAETHNSDLDVTYTVCAKPQEQREFYRADMELYATLLRALLIATSSPAVETVAAQFIKELLKPVTHPEEMDKVAVFWTNTELKHKNNAQALALHPANHALFFDLYTRVRSRVDIEILANV